MKELGKKMGLQVKKDGCGDLVIEGTDGNVHEDAGGYSLYLSFEHGKSLEAAVRKLAKIGAERRQSGDFEVVIFIPKKLALKRHKLLKKLLNPRRGTLRSAA